MLESNGLGQNQLAAASVSPGWNDPPPINSTIKVSNASSTSETTRTMTNGGAATPSAGRLHLQRQRRPVDPSVQTSENFVQLRGNTSSSANLQPAKQQQQQHFHHSRSFPQLSAAGGDAAAVNGLSPPPPPSLATTMAPQPLPPASHGRISVHPASAFTPIGALAPATAVPPPPSSITTKQQNVMPSSAIAVANAQMSPPNQFPALVPPTNFVPPHPGGSAASADNEQSPPPALAPPPVPIIPMPIQQQLPMAQVHSSAELNSFSSGYSQHSLAANLPFQQIQPVDMVNHHNQQQLQHLPTFGALATNSSMVSNGHHSSPAPPPMLFTPPNFVPIATDHHQYNSSSGAITNSTTNCFNGYQQPPMMAVPSYGGTGIDLNNYKVPVKAAGDVSLNGLQLAAFLTKATLLLQPGPTREGIQLRFNQFGEHVQAGQISEACLKKLNFVVDAIDRHVYDEAWQFFEQMVAAFHGDCTIGGWAHGVRLLLQELRKPPALAPPTAAVPTTRSHSAGMRLIH